MRRWAVLLAIAGCESPAEQPAAPPAWVYPPQPSAWPLGVAHGAIGRSQAPQLAPRGGVSGSVTGPLRLPTPWQVPGDGPARAIVYGSLDGVQAIELIEIDAGRLLWRDTTACAAPVVGVTQETVVCADGASVRGVGLDGKPRWRLDGVFVTMTGDRIVVAGAGEALIVDADTGDELGRVKLPAGVLSDSVIASCGDAGRELFASGQDNRLARIAEGPGGPKLSWSVPSDRVLDIDACDGASVLVTVSTPSGTSLVAIARDTGKTLGTVNDVRGHWPARDGTPRIETSTVTGIARWPRDLTGQGEPLEMLALGELIGQRGELRLVRASPRTAVLLDRSGVRAFLPLALRGAVLGDQALVASNWQSSRGESVHRVPYPPRYARTLRVPSGPPRAITAPAELRDLPPLTDLDASTAIAMPAENGAIQAIALADDQLFVLLDSSPGLAVFDLRKRGWLGGREQLCSDEPVSLAVVGDDVVCAARAKNRATVRVAAWSWATTNVDHVAAAGDIVLVFDADRLHVLDARGGKLLETLSSDDGDRMSAAALVVGGTTMLVTAERNRIVARLPRVEMVPAWSTDVHGVVTSIERVGDGVLVTLEDGDAYRIDARTGVATAVAGLGLAWRAQGDLITGAGDGGPIPPVGWPPAAPEAPRKAAPNKRKTVNPPDEATSLMTPIPAASDLRPSWQYTLYEATGALRVRNDYALMPPITPAAARGPLAPLVVVSGGDVREALVLEPEHGDPVRRVRLPGDTVPSMAFSTVVDGTPIVGTLLANPLRVLLF